MAAILPPIVFGGKPSLRQTARATRLYRTTAGLSTRTLTLPQVQTAYKPAGMVNRFLREGRLLDRFAWVIVFLVALAASVHLLRRMRVHAVLRLGEQ